MSLSKVRNLRKLISVEAECSIRNACVSLMPIKHRSQFSRIIHACVWKTASQWIRVIISDPRIYMHSGLKICIPPKSYLWWPDPSLVSIPKRSIVPSLYCSYEQFNLLKIDTPFFVFFVQRDPRDIIISWYFSNRYSHQPTKIVKDRREALAGLSERDGILATIDCFDEIAGMLRSWRSAADCENVRIVRYEDLTGSNAVQVWSDLLAACDIRVPEDVLRRVLDTYSFTKISGGRQPGKEDKRHKYRKGLSGDWKNYFDAEISERFYVRHGDLPQELGYDKGL